MSNVTIIIPAYQPTNRLTTMVEELKTSGFTSIVVVDDGSDDSCNGIFKEVERSGCLLLRHQKNKGKGEALKTAIKFAVTKLNLKHGVITADADGQHKVSDIIKVARVLESGTKSLVLGMRDFSFNKVPMRSYIGNKVTSKVFQSATGVACEDTQTGLRGIPLNLMDIALNTKGSRYEYEYNFLQDAAEETEIYPVKIETIYFDNNDQSHFRPIRDSLLIYQRPLKFIASSFVGFFVDIILFAIISFVMLSYSLKNIVMATVLARILSGFVNNIINKKAVFRLEGKTATSVIKYFLLFFLIMGASAVGTTGINMVLENTILSKIITDITLFLFSYTIQKNWVFAKKMNKVQISKVWRASATLFFVGYISFTLLNRFIISQNVVSLDDLYTTEQSEENTPPQLEDDLASDIILDSTVDNTQSSQTVKESQEDFEENTAKTVITEPIITETSYIDDTMEITIETIREYDTDIYIANIILSDSSQLMAGLAENSFGTNVKDKTSVILEENQGIIGINGDYYGFRDYGYVMRNGYLYRNIPTEGGNEDLVIYEDGTMAIIEESEVSAQELAESGAEQIFSFGPGLISDGEITVDLESKVEREDESNPRTAIAMIEPNHYIFMVADGRTDASEGLSLYEMAMVLSEYGCEVAYNLDGGGSATMVFMGEVINNPTTNGKSFKERSVSDIVYIG